MSADTMDPTVSSHLPQAAYFHQARGRKHSIPMTTAGPRHSKLDTSVVVRRRKSVAVDTLPATQASSQRNRTKIPRSDETFQQPSQSTSSSDSGCDNNSDSSRSSNNNPTNNQALDPPTPNQTPLTRRQSIARSTASSLSKIALRNAQEVGTSAKSSLSPKSNHLSGPSLLKRRSSMMALSLNKEHISLGQAVVKSNGPKTPAKTPSALNARGRSPLGTPPPPKAGLSTVKSRRASAIGPLDVVESTDTDAFPFVPEQHDPHPTSQPVQTPDVGSLLELCAAADIGSQSPAGPSQTTPSDASLWAPGHPKSPLTDMQTDSDSSTSLESQPSSLSSVPTATTVATTATVAAGAAATTTHPAWLANAGFMRRPKCAACGPSGSSGGTPHSHHRRTLSRANSMVDISNASRTGVHRKHSRTSLLDDKKQRDTRRVSSDTGIDTSKAIVPCCTGNLENGKHSAEPTAAATAAAAAATAAAAAVANAASIVSAAAATVASIHTGDEKSLMWTQVIQHCITQSHTLEKLAQVMIGHNQNDYSQSIQPKPVSESPIAECEALIQSQRHMLNHLETVLSKHMLGKHKPAQRVAHGMSCEELQEPKLEHEDQQQQQQQVHQQPLQLSTPPATPSLSTPSELTRTWADTLSDTVEENALKFRWQISQLVGGGVGSGRIIACDKAKDGQMGMLMVTGTCATTETQLLPKHLWQSEKSVYYHEYQFHLDDQDRKKMVLMPSEDWVPDTQVKHCEFGRDGSVSGRCDTEFTWHVRRHHCRRCGHVFCNAHSANRLPLFKTPDAKAEWSRVCDGCFYQLVGPHLK